MLNSQNPNATGVQIFKNPAFGQMRVQSNEKGEALFCLADVCKALHLSNSRMVKARLSDRGVSHIDTPTKNQYGTVVIQPITFIDEPNLYRCIFQSRKKEAEAFQGWVVEEVLPSIRKNGSYAVPIAELRQAPDVYPIKLFTHPQFRDLRTRMYKGEIMFCYNDVWRALGFNNGSTLKYKLDSNTFRYLETPTNSGVQLAGYIDEDNLSRCIFRSKSPKVAQFQEWVEKEILPVMRSEPKEIEAKEEREKGVQMKNKNMCPELAAMLCSAVNLRQELKTYGEKLEASTNESEQTGSYLIAENALNLLESALKSLYYDEFIRTQNK